MEPMTSRNRERSSDVIWVATRQAQLYVDTSYTYTTPMAIGDNTHHL